MAYLHTCRTCAVPAKTCPTRATLQAALAGLGVRSAKHRCPDFKPLFSPGDPIVVETRAWLSALHPDDDEPPICKFRGHFLRYVGSKALVVVTPGTMDANDEYELESANGFIKAALNRVWPSDWSEPVDTTACQWCAAILALGQPCGGDPHYTPPSSCRARSLPETARSGKNQKAA